MPTSPNPEKLARNQIAQSHFQLALPKAIVGRMQDELDRYTERLVTKPKLLSGKLVVEQNDVPGTGPSHTMRWLFSADFEPNKTKTQATDETYWESWMVVLAGYAEPYTFDVSSFEVYIHREGGWERVYRTHDDPTVRATQDGEVWPEPAGEPPTNKGFVDVSALDGWRRMAANPDFPQQRSVEKLITAVDDMLRAGALKVGDEITVDMRDDAQRRAFWEFQRATKYMSSGER